MYRLRWDLLVDIAHPSRDVVVFVVNALIILTFHSKK